MAAAAQGDRMNNMNLAALQQRDPFITDIVETASQVALYSFDSATQKWVKTEIEGTLFVYRRSATPINGFMILNQLGLNNLIQPITKELEFQLHDPYLLYRNTKAIYAIWFYDKDECAMIGQQMNSLLQLEVDQRQTRVPNTTRQRRASESDTLLQEQFEVTSSPKDARQVDIIQLLCKAQHEYDKVQANSSLGPKMMIGSPMNGTMRFSPLVRPLPVRISTSESPAMTAGACGVSPPTEINPTPPPTPITIEELFRKASLSQQHSPPERLRRPQSINRSLSESEPVTMNHDVPSTPPKHPLHPILQKIMGAPPMLADIERRQRSSSHSPTLPGPAGDTSLGGDGSDVGGARGNSVFATTHKYCTHQNNASHVPQMPLTPQVANGPVHHTLASLSPSSPLRPSNIDRSTTGLSSSDSDDRSFHSSTQLSPAIQPVITASAAGLLKPQDLQAASASPTKKSFIGDCLLTPNVFLSTSRLSPPSSGSGNGNASKCSANMDDSLSVAALTKEQLQQSLIFLLKTDSSFLKAIHEAYLGSLNAELDGFRH